MTISVRNLVKTYSGKRALDDISLTVREGEVYGFIGPNGAGKTTAMSILVGLIRYDSGVCEVDGSPPGDAGARGGVGYLPEQPMFSEYLTGREYLRMLGTTLGLAHPRTEAEALLDRVSLGEAGGRRIAGYSRGMRQRLGLACALLGDPRLLILDEPSSALDPEGRKDVVDLIRALKADGRTVLLSTHILSDIERICDRIALIDSGRILLEGEVDALLGQGLTGRIELQFSRILTPRELQDLAALPVQATLTPVNGGATIRAQTPVSDAEGARMALVKRIAELSLPLVSFVPVRMSLEDLFLRKVGTHA